MGKIKVLQFPIVNARGGITQYALRNWEFIDKSKFQFDFATLSKELDFEQELVQQGCKVHYISCYAEENRQQFIKEVNKIFDEGYDVVHLHTSYWKSFLVEEIAIKRGIGKIIVHSHSTMVEVLDQKKREEAINLHNLRRQQFSATMATDFCACSEMAANWLFNEQIPKNKIKIMKNAINVDEFSYNEDVRKEYRKKLGIEGCFVLGHVGRFVYPKNHEMLIEIFKHVSQRIGNARLVLIGKGILEEQIIEKVKEYGLEDKVLFMGKRSDVNSLLQAVDMFLLPSKFEGLGLALIEAQAAGLRCISSNNVPKESEITKNIEFLPLDVEKWVNKICNSASGYERLDMKDIITSAGYNIKYAIKFIEKLYES